MTREQRERYNAHRREYYQQNKEKEKKYQREYNAEHREKVNTRHNNWQRKNRDKVVGKGNKHRTSYLNAKSTCALRKYLSGRNDLCKNLFVSDYVHHKPLKKEAVEAIVRGTAKRANVAGKNITPHVFRHTTATQMLQSGVPVTDIQMLLGHENVATTMVYAHTDRTTVHLSHQRAVI